MLNFKEGKILIILLQGGASSCACAFRGGCMCAPKAYYKVCDMVRVATRILSLLLSYAL